MGKKADGTDLPLFTGEVEIDPVYWRRQRRRLVRTKRKAAAELGPLFLWEQVASEQRLAALPAPVANVPGDPRAFPEST